VSELFDEVDEDVRREQLKKLWDRYSIYIVAGALLIVAAVGGWRGYEYLEAKKAAEAGVAYDAAVDFAEQSKHAEAEAAFTKLAETAPSGYRMLARLRAAAEVASRDPQAAVKLYDDMSADRSVGAAEQDLAKVRAAGLLLETATYPTMVQRLEAAAAPTATFRQWLDMIANDGETPSGLRSRAEALQALLPPVAKS